MQDEEQKMKIAVVGLGYVGLPLACAFAKKGITAVGVDVSEKKVSLIKSGKSYISDVDSATVKNLVKKGFLRPSADFGEIKKCECVIVCVPTPLRKTHDPDISFIVSASEQIGSHLGRGTTVVLESTTYPGTTREVVAPLLEKSGLRAGKDFYLAFSPERVDPANKKWKTENTPKIIGGINREYLEKACFYYGKIIGDVVPASSLEAAEMVKLLENTFRAVNIGLINEIAQIADKLKLDVWEIVNLAGTKPFGFMPFYPGPGLGGHCIPVDPLYLSWKMRSLNFYTRFIDLAAEINSTMPDFVVDKLVKILNGFSISVKGSKILVLGVAYKKNVSDTRESPVIEIILNLLNLASDVSWFDDLVSAAIPGKRVKKLTSSALKESDIVIIATDHDRFDYDFIIKNSKLIFDLRNRTAKKKSKKIFKL